MHPDLLIRAHMIVERLIAQGKTIALAESCTGGLIASALTSVEGSSAAFRYGWVTYCPEAKESQLGVPMMLIANFGVVSEIVVAAMAEGALSRSGADYAIAVSGNAGPSAEAGDAEVGTVCMALAIKGEQGKTQTQHYPGIERKRVRDLAIAAAMDMLLRVD